MKLLRTLSTPRLVAVLVALAVVAAGSATLAVTAFGGSAETPPPAPLAQAIHDALAAPEQQGITADITFTNRLFPSGALLGTVGSALMSGATGRLWATNDGRGRLELQSDAGDVQIVWNTAQVTIYDASSNTVYKLDLPASASTSDSSTHTPPTLSAISSFLDDVSARATLSAAQPDNVAGQPAYSVTVSPKHDGGLLGSAELAWDAARGIPLRFAIYAQGSGSPVLELAATSISYGPVAMSDVAVSPPAGAKVVDLSPPAHASGSSDGSTPVSGLAAVQAAVDFPVAAPDTLVGLPRADVRLVGSGTVLALYGQGLGAIAVVERKADPGTPAAGGALASLPTVSVNGVTAHELATQLGTVISWQEGGVATVLGGSLPPAAAEAAARELR